MATWTIDQAHSEIGFKVKHLVISSVSGKFNSFEATVESEKEDFSDAKIQFSAEINSIHTGNEQRDEHLKSPDFFDAGNHPKLTFTSNSFQPNGDDYKLTGALTIHGVPKPVTQDVEI